MRMKPLFLGHKMGCLLAGGGSFYFFKACALLPSFFIFFDQ